MANSTLNARFCDTINKAGRFGDGRGGFGLALNVKPMSNGRLSKSWTQRLRIGGKPTNIGLGRYPLVSLAEARKHALENAKQVLKGNDPRGGGVPTFSQGAEAQIRDLAKGWAGKAGAKKNEQQWRGSLRDYVFPMIGATRIDKVTSADILVCLGKIWHTKPTTAKRVRQRVSAIMVWAVANGHRKDNPAPSQAIATKVLGKPNVSKRHHPSLHYAKVGDAIERARQLSTDQAITLAFELMILQGRRASEVTGARWDEFDLEADGGPVWTIPRSRMKVKHGEAYRDALSAQSVDVLRRAQALRDRNGKGTDLVFPRASGKAVATELSRVPGKLNLLDHNGENVTCHGFRTSFRVWATEQTTASELTIERQLDHHDTNQARAAYDRSDRLEDRRALMVAYGDFVQTSNNVVTLRRTG